EEQYTDLQVAVDDIAERIRAVGDVAPGSFADFLKRTAITEADNVPDATAMVKALADDQNIIINSLKTALEAAQNANDEVTVGMVTERMTVHEKNRWMLKSSV
ncbi:MAG: DNA starvation/stationary phase protection protein, partial [Alphaproteobacteria bacterium]|nr:DNA starvation/stationary phase protection protein [Alphaproteobacteria bacterium]